MNSFECQDLLDTGRTPSTPLRQRLHAPLDEVGYLQVTGQDLVLDLDAEDPAQETVFLWNLGRRAASC